MDRRTFLGATSAAALTGLGGCTGVLGGGGERGGSLPADDDPDDGYPPRLDATPEPRTVDESEFETIRVSEVGNAEVTLAPADVVHYWWRRREARVADARATYAYQKAHVFGAVSSPATTALDGPVADWPTGDRVVTYCGCPHHLSSIRAAELQRAGYSNVYVLDEGFWKGWYDREYPVRGSEVESAPETWVVEGVADAPAGAYAWAVHEPSGQMEATPIDARGRYEIHLHFYGVDRESAIRLRTPAYEFEAPLGALTDGLVTGP